MLLQLYYQYFMTNFIFKYLSPTLHLPTYLTFFSPSNLDLLFPKKKNQVISLAKLRLTIQTKAKMAVFFITLLMVMLKNGLVWIKPTEIFTPKKDWIGKNAIITWFKSKQRIILIWYVLITCFHEFWIFYF